MGDTFDLAALAYRDDLEFAIKDPAGNPTTWRVRIAGPAHAATAAFRAARMAAARRLEAARAAAEKAGQPWEPPPEADEAALFAREFAPRVLGWTPVSFSGQPFAYAPENVVRLLTDPALAFVGAQIIRQAGRLEDFFGVPAKA